MQVKFEAIRGNGYQGDIAIDAISFTLGSCSFETPRPPTITPTNPPTRPPQPGRVGPHNMISLMFTMLHTECKLQG